MSSKSWVGSLLMSTANSLSDIAGDTMVVVAATASRRDEPGDRSILRHGNSASERCQRRRWYASGNYKLAFQAVFAGSQNDFVRGENCFFYPGCVKQLHEIGNAPAKPARRAGNFGAFGKKRIAKPGAGCCCTTAARRIAAA
jgi:hypothetical protein